MHQTWQTQSVLTKTDRSLKTVLLLKVNQYQPNTWFKINFVISTFFRHYDEKLAIIQILCLVLCSRLMTRMKHDRKANISEISQYITFKISGPSVCCRRHADGPAAMLYWEPSKTVNIIQSQLKVVCAYEACFNGD